MQSVSLNSKQSRELCDEIGSMLAVQLESDAVRNKVNRLVRDYVKQKNAEDNPAELTKKLSWSVKVVLKK